MSCAGRGADAGHGNFVSGRLPAGTVCRRGLGGRRRLFRRRRLQRPSLRPEFRRGGHGARRLLLPAKRRAQLRHGQHACQRPGAAGRDRLPQGAVRPGCGRRHRAGYRAHAHAPKPCAQAPRDCLHAGRRQLAARHGVHAASRLHPRRGGARAVGRGAARAVPKGSS